MQLDYDSAAPPGQAWRRKLNSHANLLTEFKITFSEAIKMVSDLFKNMSYVVGFAFQYLAFFFLLVI